MSPLLIIAGVVAVWMYLTNQSNGVGPTLIYGKGGNTGVGGATVTGTPVTVASGTPSNSTAVTNVPGTGASGLPSTSQSTQPYQPATPGYSLSPSILVNGFPFYGLDPSSLLSSLIPRSNPGATAAAPAQSGGCGCGCSSRPTCGGSRMDGRGSCLNQPTMPVQGPTINGGSFRSPSPTPSLQQPAPINLTFLLAQQRAFDTQFQNGDVPAGPTHVN